MASSYSSSSGTASPSNNNNNTNNQQPQSQSFQQSNYNNPEVQVGEELKKKKRKQLVSCDACRLRRVKCDRVDQVLGDSCNECIKKGISCTDTYVRARPKVVRNGKLILQAKLLFGSRQEGESPEDLDSIDINNNQNASGSGSSTSSNGKMKEVGSRSLETKLFNTQVQNAISIHLIDTYAELVHPQSPIVDLALFQKNWIASGRNTSAMSPTHEVLGLVMQAFAARFSDHPSILGLNAPSSKDLKRYPGRDFSEFGMKRESFARAMADRALRVADEKGVLRRASVASTGALLMLEFLLAWDDPYRKIGRHLMAAAIEHLRSLSEGISDEAKEAHEIYQNGGPLFWMAYSRDASSSCFGDRSTCMSDRDILVLCELLSNPATSDVMTYVSSDDPRDLAGLAMICCFKFMINQMRAFSANISGPIPRRSPLDEANVREMWAVLDASKYQSSIFLQSARRVNLSSDVKYENWVRGLMSLRAQLSFVVHRTICQRLDKEELEEPNKRDSNSIESLRNLKLESDQRFLSCVRDIVEMLRACGESIDEAVLSCEFLPFFLSHMLSVPVYEEGGNPIWTFKNKVEEAEVLIDTLKILGWSWGSYNLIIKDATATLNQIKFQFQTGVNSAFPSLLQNISNDHQNQPYETNPFPNLNPNPSNTFFNSFESHASLHLNQNDLQAQDHEASKNSNNLNYPQHQSVEEEWKERYIPPLSSTNSSFPHQDETPLFQSALAQVINPTDQYNYGPSSSNLTNNSQYLNSVPQMETYNFDNSSQHQQILLEPSVLSQSIPNYLIPSYPSSTTIDFPSSHFGSSNIGENI